MAFIAALDPASKVASIFPDVASIHEAIKSYGFIPIRPDGTVYTLQEFEGGYLLDGAPLNVVVDGVWFEGQKEVLAPYWESGAVPRPPVAVTDFVRTEAMPESVAATYAAFKDSQGGSSTLLYAGIGVAAAFAFGLFGRRR